MKGHKMTTLIKADVTPLPIDLGKKEVEFNPVGSLVDAANDLQIEILEAGDPSDKKPIEIFKQQKKMYEDVKNFLKKVLGLTTSQYNKINSDWTKGQINDYAAYLLTLIQGFPVESYAAFMKTNEENSEEDSDPKKEGTESEN